MTVTVSRAGLSSRAWRVTQIASAIGLGVAMLVAFIGAWLTFNGPSALLGTARVAGVVGGVGVMVTAVLAGVSRIFFARRVTQEQIHRLAGGSVDLRSDDVPDSLTGRLLVPSDLVELDGAKSVNRQTVDGSGSSRSSKFWLWALLVALFGGILFTRFLLVAVATASHGSAGDALGILLWGTLLAAGAPIGVLLALGAARNRNLRRLVPGSFLVGTVRHPPLEFGLVRLLPSTEGQIHSNLVWSFGADGASLWQGAPAPRMVATIPRDRILGIGLQEAAEMVGSIPRGRLVIVTTSSEGDQVTIPFVVRLLSSPWTLRNGHVVEEVRSQVLAALGSGHSRPSTVADDRS